MTFTCGSCLAEFRSRVARDRHFEDARHRAPEHECPAPSCPEFRDSDFELWQHMESCPKLERTKFSGVPWRDMYTYCDYCESIFRGTTAMDDHECIEYWCDYCDDVFHSLTALTRHLTVIFSMEFEFLDDSDSFREALYDRIKLDDRRGLLDNLESVHYVHERHADESHRMGEKYECHMCLKTFDEKHGLQEHFWSHARGYPGYA